MLTAHARALIALLGMVTLAGCATSATHASPADALAERRESLRFDNEGRDRVDVYLVGEKRSWRIGRLEPGQTRWLRVPRDIPPSDMSRVQLVVLANAQATMTPMLNPRAVMTLRQPVYVLSGQRWAFADGQLNGLRVGGALKQ